MSQKKPNFDKIEPYDLQRPERLKELYIEAVRRGFWLNTEAAALNFFAFAEKALADDKYGTPGKLFYALIKQKNFYHITDGQEDRARAKLTSYERSELVDAAGSNTGLVAPANDEIQNILRGPRHRLPPQRDGSVFLAPSAAKRRRNQPPVTAWPSARPESSVLGGRLGCDKLTR